MTLALATRGYLCRTRGGGGSGVCPTLPGPTITGTAAVTPDLKGAKLIVEEGPTITGAGIPGPQIDGGSAPPVTPAGNAPTINKAGILTPDIDSGKES